MDKVNVSGLVYIITDGQYYKIGMTTGEAHKRMKEIQTMNPRKLEVIYQMEMNFPYDYERLLHDLFKHKRLKGEWFELTKEDIPIIKDVLNNKVYTRVGPNAFIKIPPHKPPVVRVRKTTEEEKNHNRWNPAQDLSNKDLR